MTQIAPTRLPNTSKRKQYIILLAIAVFFLLAILVSQTAFDLTLLRPGNNQQIVVFYALSLLISLLFVALTFVLARNLLKLFAERRLGVLGSKFRTRMVVGALLLSFVPVMVMYWFAYGLMNRSIDKWFSTPVEEVRARNVAVDRAGAGSGRYVDSEHAQKLAFGVEHLNASVGAVAHIDVVIVVHRNGMRQAELSGPGALLAP